MYLLKRLRNFNRCRYNICIVDRVCCKAHIIINQSVWMTDYEMHGGIIMIFDIRGCHGDGGLF